MPNNYDCSSSGINIECSIGYDQDMAQINFDESFQRIAASTLYYNPWGNLPSLTSLGQLYACGSSSQIKKLKHALRFCHSYTDFSWATDTQSLWEEWLNNYSIATIKDFVSDSEYYGIRVKDLFIRTRSRGYFQGDYCEIFVPLSLAKCWGVKELDMDDIQKDIDHLLWDAPMRARIDVNSEEFISNKFDGQYEVFKELSYDKDVIIQECLDFFKDNASIDQSILKSELESVVPRELSYD